MASAKRAKSKIKGKGKRVEVAPSRVLPKAKAPQTTPLAKRAKKAIQRSVKSATDTAKKVASGARKGIEKQAAAIAERANLAKKKVAKKAKRVAKKAVTAKDSVAKQAKSVAKQAKGVAKQAKAAVVANAGKARQVARDKAGAVKEQSKASKAPSPDAGANGTVAVGSPAPSFSLPDQSGNVVTSESLKGAPYVLYFYPKDDTPGCTKEACGFRDSGAAFGKNGVRVIGVSPDSETSHTRFVQKYGLPFTLLSDVDKKLAAAYGVWVEKQNYGRKYMGIERSTFLVDGKGRVQKIWRGVRVPGHVEDVLLASGTI